MNIGLTTRDSGHECLAEREGFEPPVPVKARTLSRRLVSTTHPSLRVVDAHPICVLYFISTWHQFTVCCRRNRFPLQIVKASF
jgi:hypothetical protein